jgi:hypothetical protein
MQYLTLDPERLRETHQRLYERIATRFPASGLSEVAGELGTLVDVAAVRAETIRRPNFLLRTSIALLLTGALGLGCWMAFSSRFQADLWRNRNLFELVEVLLRASVFLMAVIVFLITLETRLKRRRALAALHELRALAHVVDMHQVAKDPEGALKTEQPTPTIETPADLYRYLHYCNELLALISKVAALYVQEFPDAPTVMAVDQVEDLCGGLSQKIWQKLMMLDQLLDEKAVHAG